MAKESKEVKEQKALDKKIKEQEKQAFINRVNAKAQGKELAKAAEHLNQKSLNGLATDAEKKLIKSLLKVLGK